MKVEIELSKRKKWRKNMRKKRREGKNMFDMYIIYP